jgi:hypothetical protein
MMKHDATMDRLKLLIDKIVRQPMIRKLFAMDERGVTPTQTGVDPVAKRDLTLILAVGGAIVLFGIVVAFLGLF